ncbi:Hypothetical predicted protein [Marmota monax]|uniref:Uncharacterized protein n=1 Tax=Marmota monax TaxID=9995 RepID=A0A5E4BV49_MARMO|nr:hypothetical protein GHT09_013018 [Marmota monax]VTJ72861.1 Hypothetical predicted protein [Marmota monax]
MIPELAPTSCSRRGESQHSPAPSNGPNGRRASCREAERPASPASPSAPCRAEHVTIPPRGELLTVTAPGSGGESPLAVSKSGSRSPAGPHRRGGTQRLAPTAPPPPRAPAFPAPDRAALRPLQPPPSPRQVREVPTPPPHAGAAGLAAAHWLR